MGRALWWDEWLSRDLKIPVMVSQNQRPTITWDKSVPGRADFGVRWLATALMALESGGEPPHSTMGPLRRPRVEE